MAGPDGRVPPTRRTQRERRASSRALILDAALDQLVEHGYVRTTTVTVQKRAGVSRGRLLHHFPSREALLVAAAQHMAVEQISEMELWVERSSYGRTHGVQRSDLAVNLLWETFRQPYFWAALELWAVARTDSEVRDSLLPEEQRLGVAIRNVVATMFGPVLSSHSAFTETRELLFTSMRGVAMTYALDPRDPETDPHLPLWRGLARRQFGFSAETATG